MDLTQFIKTTLVSIRNGVVEANKETSVYRLTPGSDRVDFDVAIEVAREKGSDKGGGLSVKVVEGKISSSSKSTESSYSRIKFSVGISTNIK